MTWKKVSVVVLIVLGCLLLVLSIFIIWLKAIVLDTDRYVDTVGPLASDPAIQQAVSDRISDAVFDPAAFEQRLSQSLPQQVAFLAPFITDRTNTLVDNEIHKAVTSDRFQQLWVDANRAAHSAAVKVLTGGGDVVTTANGQVSIDLSAIRDYASQLLQQHGIDVLGPASADNQLVLFDSPALAKIQSLVNLLVTLAWLLPIVGIVFLAGAVLLARQRMLALAWVGLGIAIAVGLILIVTSQLRSNYLNSLNSEVTRNARAAALDIILGSMRTTLQTAFVAGLVLAVGSFIAGPWGLAVRLRQAARGGLERTGERLPTGRVGTFVSDWKNALRILGLVVALLVLVFVSQVTPAILIVTVVALLVWFALVEIVSVS